MSTKTREHKLKEAIVPTSAGFHEGVWPNMPREGWPGLPVTQGPCMEHWSYMFQVLLRNRCLLKGWLVGKDVRGQGRIVFQSLVGQCGWKTVQWAFENFEAHLNLKWEESAKLTRESLKYNPGLPPCGDSRYSTLTVTLNDGRLCSQVNGRGATEPERNSKLSVSPSPSNASSNTSLGTPPASTPPEVRPRPRASALHRALLTSSLTLFSFPGLELRHHPGAQHVPAAGQRARTPEALQQEGPHDGLDQEKRTLQQPIEHFTSYTGRFSVNPTTKWFVIFYHNACHPVKYPPYYSSLDSYNPDILRCILWY